MKRTNRLSEKRSERKKILLKSGAYLIVTDAEKTEKNYFEGIKNIIPDNLKNDVGDPKDEYLWLTIKFSNLTQEKFNSLRNLEFTFFDPDNVINQVDGKFYEYNGAWITNQEINGVNYESFKALKF